MVLACSLHAPCGLTLQLRPRDALTLRFWVLARVAQPAIPESAPRDKALSCNDLSAWSTAPHLPEHAPHARALQRDCAAHPSNYKKLAQ